MLFVELLFLKIGRKYANIFITFFLYFFAAVKGSANVGSTQVRSESAESVLVCNAHCAFVTHKTNPDAQLCMLWPK